MSSLSRHNPITAHFDEAKQSQLPFVELLINMGYQYISCDEASKQRRNDTGKFILQDIAFESLKRINDYDPQGRGFKFNDDHIWEAINDLENIPYEGLIDTSKKIFNMIMPTEGGKTIEVFDEGTRRSRNFRFIDFKNIENNSFHIAVEFKASGRSNIRPDIVVFVNGIPFAVIENKKGGVEISEAIRQHIRNQEADYCPRLFAYPQLLVVANGSFFKYGSVDSSEKYFVDWKERDADELDKYVSEEQLNERVKTYISKKIDKAVYDSLLSDLNGHTFGHKQKTDRSVKEQDRGAVCMFEFERLLDLCKNYVLFDAGKKKISRYQQYFAIRKMIKRVEEKEDFEGGKRRKGGLVWHTQGSGKSLTMVMFVKALIEHPHIVNPRVIIVTDRRDLDKQIGGTFKDCNLKRNVYRAKSGEDLLEQIKNKNRNVLTTLVHKFDSIAKKRGDFVDKDENIFVLIDEAHRTQSGKANLEMNRVIPNACYVAFTGTPLMKKERPSWKKFGGYIDKYTIDDALKDKIILPLIYEGRYVEMTQQSEQIDRQADRVCEEPKKKYGYDFKKHIDRRIMENNPGRMREIALDIEKHYIDNFQGTGLKAQLVAPSKYAAVLFQQQFEQSGKIQTAIVMSDENGLSSKEDEHKKEVEDYLKKIKDKYSGLNSYEKQVIDSFKHQEDGVEIIIVVDKLLTGFDAPRNTVLYLTKDLRDHNLLQAIARVNRIFDNKLKAKTAGFIIDYSENAKNLQTAMQLFGNFDPDDLENALIDTDAKIEELRGAYHRTHDFFNGTPKDDSEALVGKLKEETDREKFYENLRDFTRLFNECLALQDFSVKFGKDIDLYKTELNKFMKLRKMADLRYADKLDADKYRYSLVKILDKYVDASGVHILTDQIDINDSVKFGQSLEMFESDRAKAEVIASQLKRTIQEKYQEADPEFYARFSHKIKAVLDKMREGKMSDVEALGQMRLFREDILNKKDDSLPSKIADEPGADIFYRNIEIGGFNKDEKIEIMTDIAKIIKEEAIVDWQNNYETQRIIMNRIDDYLYDIVKGEKGIELNAEETGLIVEKTIDLAKKNFEVFSV